MGGSVEVRGKNILRLFQKGQACSTLRDEECYQSASLQVHSGFFIFVLCFHVGVAKMSNHVEKHQI